MTKPPPELLAFLHRHDANVRALALALRRVVIEELSPCHEYIFMMRRRVMLLYGPTSRVIDDCVCMIAVYGKHANLQFTSGIELNDPHGLLEGSGTRMRHVKIRAAADLERPELRELLRQGRRDAGPVWPRAEKGSVVTRVKAPRV